MTESLQSLYPHLSVAGQTDQGRRRAENQDALTLLPDHGLFCVADGIGGSIGGAGASMAVVQSVEKAFGDLPDPRMVRTAHGKARLFGRAVDQASTWIKTTADQLGYPTTGTTAVALIFDAVQPHVALAMHAGDSPLFRLRNGSWEKLIVEHSYIAENNITDPSSIDPRLQHMITRAVGVELKARLDTTPVDVQEGDLFLLCSDGLTGMVPTDPLLAILRENEDPQIAVGKLVDAANQTGGVDNITVILVKVGPLPTIVWDEDDEPNATVAPSL